MAATAPAPRRTAVRWRILLLILVIVTINYVDRASLSIAMPTIAREFDISPTLQGIIFSAFFWSYAAMQIPAGWLADRYPLRLIVAGATIAWGLVQAMTGLAGGWVGLLIARIGLGVAEGPTFPSFAKLNVMWLPVRERGRGSVILDGGAPLGTAFGGLLIAALIGWFGSWRIAFVLAGLGTVAVGLLAYWYIRDRPGDHPAANAAEIDYIAAEHALEDGPAGAEDSRANIVALMRFRSFWGLILGYFGFDLVFYGLVSWGPNYLAREKHFGLQAIGGATFLIFGAGFVGEMIGGILLDFWKGRGGMPNRVMRTMLGISGALTTLSTFLLTQVDTPVAAVALLSSTLFFLRWSAFYWSIPPMLVGRRQAGIVIGMMNFSGNVGGIVGPILVGVIVQQTGSYFLALMMFTASGLLYLTGSLMIDYERKLWV